MTEDRVYMTILFDHYGALLTERQQKLMALRNTRHPLGQRFIKPLEHAEKVERHVAPLSRKK